MLRLKATLLAVALVSLAALSARAETGLENLPIGSVVKETARLGERQFPLPAGDWQLVARERRLSGGPAQAVPLVYIYLAQIKNGVLANYIYAITNLEPNHGGWLRNTDICDRSDVHHAVFDRNYNNRDVECWTVNHLGMTSGANATQVHRDFYRFTDDKRRPRTGLSINYFLVATMDYLSLSYWTNPELAGFEPTPTADWRGNPWHRNQIHDDPKRADFIQQLKAEGEKLLPLVKAGMRGKLPPGTVSVGPKPSPAEGNAVAPASAGDKPENPAERLRQLKRLFEEKLMTEAEYEVRRRKILDEM